MNFGELLNHSPSRVGKSHLEHLQRPNKNRLQDFLEKHKDQYETITIIQGTKFPRRFNVHIPKSELIEEKEEQNKRWYLDSVKSALNLDLALIPGF